MHHVLVRVVVAAALALALVACAPKGGGVSSVTIDGGDRSVVVGGAHTFTVTVVTLGGASSAVTWGSSDPDVATIDASGTALGIGVGTAEITASSAVDSSKRDSVTLAVDPPGALRWTRQFGTSSSDEARAVATDADGRVYLVGSSMGALVGVSAGGADAFVRAYDGNGAHRWTRQFGTSANDGALGVATDAGGNVYVTGYTEGALEGANAGGSDVFVRAYDGSGELRWTRQFGTSVSDVAVGVATDPVGNVYIVGYTWGALEGASAGGFDVFVRAYDGSGELRWTRQFGTSGTDLAQGVATDASGNVFVVGQTLGHLEGTSAGHWDAFVRAYDHNGDLRWTRQFGTSSREEAGAIATDTGGNVYVTGYTEGALEGVSAGGFDVFVRSYASSGELRWTRQFGTSSTDRAFGITTGPTGGIYVAGSTSGALEGANAGGDDAFVRAYDGSGELRWTRQFGTTSSDRVQGVATDLDGIVYATGRTGGVLDGAHAGDDDAFVRSYGP